MLRTIIAAACALVLAGCERPADGAEKDKP
jgi:hypothetical protein